VRVVVFLFITASIPTLGVQQYVPRVGRGTDHPPLSGSADKNALGYAFSTRRLHDAILRQRDDFTFTQIDTSAGHKRSNIGRIHAYVWWSGGISSHIRR
jgi:hypothetical protein